MRILVIDDEVLIRENITDLLESEGHSVTVASDGQEGLETAIKMIPDVILCDVKMPVMTGFEAVKLLREDSRTCAVPIILLTGYAENFTMREAMEIGADDFIVKPYTKQMIINAVNARVKRMKVFEEKAQEKVGYFVDRISLAIPHELRTPLASLIGYSDFLMRYHSTLSRDEMIEIFRIMFLSSKDLHDTIEKFILYSRLQAHLAEPGKVEELLSRTASLKTAVNDIINKATYMWERMEDVHINIADIALKIDDFMLSRLIDNLLSNAVKFSEVGSPIELNVTVDGDNAVIMVSNIGRGMTSEQIEAISVGKQFDRDKFEQQGMGFGLANVHGIVHLFKGSLDIQSVPGEKTTVTVRLPLAEQRCN